METEQSKNEIDQFKVELELSRLRRREKIMKQARGRNFGFNFWTGIVLGIFLFLIGTFSLRTAVDIRGIFPGVLNMIIGMVCLNTANQVRLNLRIDAILTILAEEKLKDSVSSKD